MSYILWKIHGRLGCKNGSHISFNQIMSPPILEEQGLTQVKSNPQCLKITFQKAERLVEISTLYIYIAGWS